MKHTTKLALFFTVLAALLLAGGVLAMRSTHYWLDWYELQPGASGAAALQSGNYKLRDSIGAPLVITMHSPQYSLDLGYWPGVEVVGQMYLPLLIRQ